MKKTVALLGVVGLAAAASAQSNGTYIIMASNDVDPMNTSTTISVYAAWDQANPGDFVLGAGNYDLVASDGDFTGANLVLGADPPNNAGTPAGSRVNGAAIGQVHLPTLGLPGSPDNPILLAEYTWTTTNFANRTVDLSTENTTQFSVVPGPGGVSINLVNSGAFSAGSGSFNVTPAPSALALLGLGGLVAARRRR